LQKESAIHSSPAFQKKLKQIKTDVSTTVAETFQYQFKIHR